MTDKVKCSICHKEYDSMRELMFHVLGMCQEPLPKEEQLFAAPHRARAIKEEE